MKRFQHKFTLPLILTMLVLAVAGLLIGFFNLKRQTTLPSNSNTSAIGVELDQDFDYVDLHKLEDNGISFIYLRSTQGKSYFDDNYLSYREQVQGTKLAFGSMIYYSNQSTADEQYQYFVKKVGIHTGTLPVMLVPAVKSRSKKYLKSMAAMTSLIQQQLQRKVIIALNVKYKKYFPVNTLFLASGSKQPNKLNYAFWRYTTDGRVKDVDGLEHGLTMFSYNGTVTQYKQNYGQLTQ